MLTITQRPSKAILDDEGATVHTSKWNAAHLPIIYKLSSDKYPTNSADGIDLFTSVYGTNGYATIELGINYEPYQELEYVHITNSSVEEYNGIWQIRDYVDGNTLIIQLSFNGTATGNIQKYYNNYHALVRVYAGLPATHPLNASKPMELIATIRQIPDSNNNITVDVHKLIQDKIRLKDEYALSNIIDVDLNAFTGFYIEYADSYDAVEDGEIVTETSSYTSDSANTHWAINSIMPFQSTYGGNMGEYVFAYNTLQIAGRFLANYDELIQVNGKKYDLSAIIPKAVFDNSANNFVQFVVKQHARDGNISAIEERLSITNRHDGVYRLRDTINNEYNEDTKYLKVQLMALPIGGNIFTDATNGTFEGVDSGWNTTEGAGVSLIRESGGYEGTYRGKVEYISSEMVSDGDFSTGIPWTTGAGWSLPPGAAQHTGALTGNLVQSIGIIEGATYRVSFTITGYSVVFGSSYLALGNIGNTIPINNNGTYEQDITVSGFSNGWVLVSGSDNLIIDNISVKELPKPAEVRVFSGDTAIPVTANRDYILTAYIKFPERLLASSNTGTFAYLRPASLSLADCATVYGARTVTSSFFGVSTNRIEVYRYGNHNNSIVLGSGLISPINNWNKITTLFNTGANTSINIGLYLNGTLSNYVSGGEIHIDKIELRGPIEYLSDEYTINIDHSCSNQEITLRWLNNLGGWDQFTFTGKKEYTVDTDDKRFIRDVRQDWDTDFINGNEEEDIQSRTSREAVRVRSQYVEKEYLDNVLKGILKSSKVYRVQDDKLLTVLIEPSSYDIYKDMDRLYALEFDMIYSNIGRSQEQ
jgi:hypothetical protein